MWLYFGMAERDLFGMSKEARRLLRQSTHQDRSVRSSSASYDLKSEADRTVRHFREDVSAYFRELEALRVPSYTFAGKAPRGNFSSTADAYNPIYKRRRSRQVTGGIYSSTDRWHDIRFRGWPIGDLRVSPVSGEDSIDRGCGLILLEVGKIALSSGGIFGCYDGEASLMGSEGLPRIPSRSADIDVGRLYGHGFPVSIGSLAAKHFKEALGSEVSAHDLNGLPTNRESLRLTMSMVLEQGR